MMQLRRLCVLGGFAGSALGQINVMAPGSIRGEIEGSTSTFGAPFYGDKIVGQLFYAEPTSSSAPHCHPDDYHVPMLTSVTTEGENAENAEKPLLRIFVVNRGGCSFVKKVKTAQDKGAEAVILVDQDPSRHIAEIRRIIVADDGFGSAVTIPSILVPNMEGLRLIHAAKETTPVIVELDWQVPTDHVVRVDMWMSAGSQESQRFLREFAPARKALNDALRFVPHYAVFGMDQPGEENDELCEDKTGKFCAEDPDGPGPVTSREVLDEDVRQLCIHEIYKKPLQANAQIGRRGATPEYADEYWNYIQRLDCPLDGKTDDAKFGKTCSKKHMRAAHIDVDKVEECANKKRYEYLKEQVGNVAWSPRALRINGVRYNGALDADVVTKAICAGFVSPPAACKELVKPIVKWRHSERVEGVGWGTFILVIISFNILACVGLMVYKRTLKQQMHTSLREEVMLEVQAQMGAYKELQDV